MTDTKYVLTIDQGVTLSCAIIFDYAGRIVAVGRKEHEWIFPRAGWAEYNAAEIWNNVYEVVAQILAKVQLSKENLVTVDVTNRRGATLVWDRKTGGPVYNAIVWQDTRTQKIVEKLGGEQGADQYKGIVGLPLITYFSGSKVKRVLDNVGGARERVEASGLVMGTMDTWILWDLIGGVKGGVHITGVTNASRAMLMNLKTLD